MNLLIKSPYKFNPYILEESLFHTTQQAFDLFNKYHNFLHRSIEGTLGLIL